MVVPLDTWAQHVGLLISYYITFSFWSAQTLALSLISRNIAGQTKKSVAITINFIIWATGNAVGEYYSSMLPFASGLQTDPTRCEKAHKSS